MTAVQQIYLGSSEKGGSVWRAACGAAFILFCAMIPAGPAFAEFSAQHLQIAARAMSFLEKPMVGETRAGIVYDPASAQSEKQAQQLVAYMSAGKRVGNIILKPVLVPVDRANRANVDFFLLTDGLGAGAAQFAKVTAGERTPCVTADIGQVKSGYCLMGIHTAPRVEILVNKTVAERIGVQFATAFRVMIREF